jgi:hypothetical protein
MLPYCSLRVCVFPRSWIILAWALPCWFETSFSLSVCLQDESGCLNRFQIRPDLEQTNRALVIEIFWSFKKEYETEAEDALLLHIRTESMLVITPANSALFTAIAPMQNPGGGTAYYTVLDSPWITKISCLQSNIEQAIVYIYCAEGDIDCWVIGIVWHLLIFKKTSLYYKHAYNVSFTITYSIDLRTRKPNCWTVTLLLSMSNWPEIKKNKKFDSPKNQTSGSWPHGEPNKKI